MSIPANIQSANVSLHITFCMSFLYVTSPKSKLSPKITLVSPVSGPLAQSLGFKF